MRLDRPLDDLFESGSHVRVLRALHELPDGFRASAREVARRAGLSHPTASRVLAALLDQGLVSVSRGPRADAFALNPDHVAIPQLKNLFAWEHGLRDELLSFLRREIVARADVVQAFLFGSVVREEMSASSDIDIAVLCPPDRVDEVSAAMEEVGEAVRARFGNRVSFVVGADSLEHLSQPRRPGHRLWRQIAREGIPIIPSQPVVHGA
jgi:DNA-binding transcriptional ArsR family regulator